MKKELQSLDAVADRVVADLTARQEVRDNGGDEIDAALAGAMAVTQVLNRQVDGNQMLEQSINRISDAYKNII